MARLDQVITNIVDIFLEYDEDGGGKKSKLNKDELKNVLDKELQSPELREKINVDDVENVMKEIDKNHDEELNFREFSRWVGELAREYYRKKTGKEPGKRGKRGKGRPQAAEEED